MQSDLHSDVAERVRLVAERATLGDHDGAFELATPLFDLQTQESKVAEALIVLVAAGSFSVEQSCEVANAVFEAYAHDESVLAALGNALEKCHDIRFINAPGATHPIFERVARRLQDALSGVVDPEREVPLQQALGTVGRLLGRAWDPVTEAARRRVCTLHPERWQDHYDLGLFYKTRGRFAEGMAANLRAAELGGADDEAVLWNLGICATGANEGERALRVWQGIKQHIAMGRFGLPEGNYHTVKVRLAERPIAERVDPTGPDDPGLEESVWVERLSPCHGIVRCALFQDLGVDYGDVVLFDGAAVTFQTVNDVEVPVFPHLVTLRRSGYVILPFVGTQEAPGQVQSLSGALPGDAVLYSHSEQVVTLCNACWESGGFHLGHRRGERKVVTGKLCCPPALDAAELLVALDAAIAAQPAVKVLVPELARRAGETKRAAVEERRFRMVVPSE